MARSLPGNGESLLVRTDFSDDALWDELVAAATRPTEEGHVAGLTVIDDAAFDGLTLGDLASVIGSPPPYFVFLADTAAVTDTEHSVLAVDTSDRSAAFPTFRVHPSQMAVVENNLSLANVDFDDFLSAVGADGVYRGVETPPTTRALSKAALLAVIDRSTLSAEAIAVYRASLANWSRPEVDGRYVHDVREGHDELVRRRQHDEYRYSSWVIGLDESIAELAKRIEAGAVILFGFPGAANPSAAGLPSGSCSVWVDFATLMPVAILASGRPLRRSRT